MNLITTLNHITDIAESLQLVNSAYKGSPYDHWNSSEIKYGSVCVAVENVSRDSLMTYNLVLYYADRLTQDRSNIYEVQTDATNILTSILNSLEEIGEVETPYNIELFDQQFSDYLAGGFVRFGLVIESPLGDCEMEDYEEDPTPYYIDKNGTYHLNGNYLLDVDVPQSGNLQSKTVELRFGGSVIVTPDKEFSGLSDVVVKQAPVDMSKISLTYGVVGQWVNEADWSTKTRLDYCFRSSTSDGSTNYIKINAPEATSMLYCFAYTTPYVISRIEQVELEGLQKVEDCDNAFYYCEIPTIILPDKMPLVKSARSMFGFTYAKVIHMPYFGSSFDAYSIFSYAKVEALYLGDFSNCTFMGNAFQRCSNLTDLYVDKLPDINLNDWKLDQYCPLTKQSILNIINALPESTKHNSCSLGAAKIAKLTDEEIAIATDKGWTLI